MLLAIPAFQGLWLQFPPVSLLGLPSMSHEYVSTYACQNPSISHTHVLMYQNPLELELQVSMSYPMWEREADSGPLEEQQAF